MCQGAAPASACATAGGFFGGSALPRLESRESATPTPALVARYSAPVFRNSRRRAYSSGAVISELLGCGGSFGMLVHY
jgi:hypothetical protein